MEFYFKKIQDDETLVQYSNEYLNSVKSYGIYHMKEIPLAYFKKSNVVGVFNGENHLVGGYVLNQDYPLRLLNYVPQTFLREELHEFPWSDCIEITCVWKKKGTLRKNFMNKIFWPKVFQEFLNSKKKYLLGHNQNNRLDKRYDLFGQKTLYVGPSVHDVPSRLFVYTRFHVWSLVSFAKYIFPLLPKKIQNIF